MSTCDKCEYFEEFKKEDYKMGSLPCFAYLDDGQCKRYPQEIRKSKDDWCGEFAIKEALSGHDAEELMQINTKRLIDANALKEFPKSKSAGTAEQIQDWIQEIFSNEIIAEYNEELTALCWLVINGFINLIDTQPTAYDIDKVVRELEASACKRIADFWEFNDTEKADLVLSCFRQAIVKLSR